MPAKRHLPLHPDRDPLELPGETIWDQWAADHQRRQRAARGPVEPQEPKRPWFVGDTIDRDAAQGTTAATD